MTVLVSKIWSSIPVFFLGEGWDPMNNTRTARASEKKEEEKTRQG
jgi:hypothetical protein